MHWCMDETLALLAMIPFIGYFFHKLHAWWHTKFHHKCHKDGCDSDHVEHTYSPFDRNNGDNLLTKGDILLLTGWDSITQDDVEERFGGSLIDDLIGDTYLLKVDERPADDEFRWFVNDDMHLKAVFREKVFVHDDDCCEHGWNEVDQ